MLPTGNEQRATEKVAVIYHPTFMIVLLLVTNVHGAIASEHTQTDPIEAMRSATSIEELESIFKASLKLIKGKDKASSPEQVLKEARQYLNILLLRRERIQALQPNKANTNAERTYHANLMRHHSYQIDWILKTIRSHVGKQDANIEHMRQLLELATRWSAAVPDSHIQQGLAKHLNEIQAGLSAEHIKNYQAWCRSQTRWATMLASMQATIAGKAPPIDLDAFKAERLALIRDHTQGITFVFRELRGFVSFRVSYLWNDEDTLPLLNMINANQKALSGLDQWPHMQATDKPQLIRQFHQRLIGLSPVLEERQRFPSVDATVLAKLYDARLPATVSSHQAFFKILQQTDMPLRDLAGLQPSFWANELNGGDSLNARLIKEAKQQADLTIPWQETKDGQVTSAGTTYVWKNYWRDPKGKNHCVMVEGTRRGRAFDSVGSCTDRDLEGRIEYYRRMHVKQP